MDCAPRARPHRLIFHCRPQEVTEALVKERLAKELKAEAEICAYSVDALPYFLEVSVVSGSRYLPVTVVTLTYVERADKEEGCA